MATRVRSTSRSRTIGLSRRAFLTTAAAVGASSGLGARGQGPSRAARGGAEQVASNLKNNIYTRLLGVRPHLPAHPNITRLSGSRMSREVMDAMAEANEYCVDMAELIEAAGRRVAEVTGAEAGIVTSGATSAQLLGAAACLTGLDPQKLAAVPQVTWARRECLIQKAHRSPYDHAYRAAGMVIVEVETREQMQNAISDRTAMIAGTAAVEKQRQPGPPIPRHRATQWGPEVMRPEELARIGNRAGVPVLIDAAAEVPPAGNLTRFIASGVDLVAISGGKGLFGPQSTGILAGRRDLIDAARRQNAPNDGLGRAMKVGKEEIIGFIVALNQFVARDHEAVVNGWNRKAQFVADELKGVRGLTAEYALNTSGQGVVELTWDEKVIPLTQDQVRVALAAGEPRVVLFRNYVWTSNLRDGEEVLVVRRLREVFTQAARG